MQHPFAGVLPGPDHDPGTWDRRRLLQALVAGGVAGAASAGWQSSLAQEKAAPEKNASQGSGHRLYVVVPKDLRRFGTRRRAELGVWGPYFPLQQPKQPPQAGFLAWLTPQQAEKLSGNQAVAQVVPLESKHVPGPGPQPRGATQLLVELAPNSFHRKPPGHYEDTNAVVRRWLKQLARWVNVGLEMEPLTGRDGFVVVRLPMMNRGQEEVVRVIKSHPQVVRVRWYQPQPTTLALGEEGGPRPTTARGREEGGITTQALGEEGGPTTRALHEEGNRGPLTPLNGEAGNATTKALNEEGGVTTFALGEEGGPRPKPRRN